jgi:hypothetical protein
MRCPNCGLKMAFDRSVFRTDFLCQRCGANLVASETYSRVLWLISVAISFVLPWLTIFRFGQLRPFAGFMTVLVLVLPLAFVMMFFLVRVAPTPGSPSPSTPP